jgi:2-oxoisovalerate dehydrogenase E1 component beta subunit
MPERNYLEAIRRGLFEEMERDPAVFIMGQDVGHYGGAFQATAGLLERFGEERVIDAPLSESAIIGAGAGAAMLGFRPVLEIQFMDFIANGFNQIVNMVAKMHYRWGPPLPLVIRGPAGGGVHGGPFHSQNPEMWFVHTPGLKVVAPSTAYDAKGLIKAAIRDNNPVLYLEHKYLYRRIKDAVPDDDYVVPLGQAVLRRVPEGKPGDISVITYGAMVWVALEAARQLAEEGIELEVLDLRTLYPLDLAAVLATVRRTNKVILLHEDNRTGGLGGELAAIIAEQAFEDLDGPIVRVTAPDTPMPFSPPMEQVFLPQASDVVRAARQLAAY